MSCGVCVWVCVCVCDFEKRDMFCLFQHVFRQRFLLVTRTDAFGGLSCAGMCENVCVFICVCVCVCMCVCVRMHPYNVCVSSCLCLYVCLFVQLLPHMFVLSLSMWSFPCLFKCIQMHSLCVCKCAYEVCVCVCEGEGACARAVHSQTRCTVYLRLERTEKKNTLQ